MNVPSFAVAPTIYRHQYVSGLAYRPSPVFLESVSEKDENCELRDGRGGSPVAVGLLELLSLCLAYRSGS